MSAWELKLGLQTVLLNNTTSSIEVGRHESCSLRVDIINVSSPEVAQSVSRKHCLFTLEGDKLKVKDISRFGTFVRGIKIASNHLVELYEGDTVVLGVSAPEIGNTIEVFKRSGAIKRSAERNHNSKHEMHQKRVKHEFVWTYSKLNAEGKQDLKRVASQVGAKVVQMWSDECTHLITDSELIVTDKVLNALLDDRPVTTLRWVHEIAFLEAMNVDESYDMPDPKEYAPEFLDNGKHPKVEIDFDVKRTSRKKLFAGLNFIFFEVDQMDRNANYLTKSGGSSIRVELSTFTTEDLQRLMSLEQNILVQPKSVELRISLSQHVSSIKRNVMNSWKKFEVRDPVEEGDIMQCILCPQKYSLKPNLLSTGVSQTYTAPYTPSKPKFDHQKQNREQAEPRNTRDSNGNSLLVSIRSLDKSSPPFEPSQSGGASFKKFKRKPKINDQQNRSETVTYIANANFKDIQLASAEIHALEEKEEQSDRKLDNLLERDKSNSFGMPRARVKGNIFRI